MDKDWFMHLSNCCFLQFTLQSILKGNKPDFHLAMGSDTSEAFFMDFIEKLGKSYDPNKVKR